MSSTSLLVRDDARLSVATTGHAEELKEKALAIAGIIGRVSNDAENAKAVEAQKELKRVLKLVEADREEVKKPVLNLCRAIDATAKQFVAELDAEYTRVGRLAADYQSLLLQKARAAEAARLEALAKIERDREAAIAKAKSTQEVENIIEKANDEALMETVKLEKSAPIKAEGQTVREEWMFEATDLHALARAHPNCVTITPLAREIKALLAMGVTVHGVRAWKETKSNVRV